MIFPKLTVESDKRELGLKLEVRKRTGTRPVDSNVGCLFSNKAANS